MDCRRYNVYKLEQLESYDTSLNYLWWYSSIPSKGTRQKKKNVENSTLGLTKGGPFGEKKLVEKNMV